MNLRFHLPNIKGYEILYNIVLKRSAAKDLDKINEPYLSSIITSIEELERDPRNIHVKKLIDRGEEYRLRVGDYRI